MAFRSSGGPARIEHHPAVTVSSGATAPTDCSRFIQLIGLCFLDAPRFKGELLLRGSHLCRLCASSCLRQSRFRPDSPSLGLCCRTAFSRRTGRPALPNQETRSSQKPVKFFLPKNSSRRCTSTSPPFRSLHLNLPVGLVLPSSLKNRVYEKAVGALRRDLLWP